MKRIIVAFVAFVLVMTAATVGIVWLTRRPEVPPPPPILVPHYAEPEDNGFDELAQAAEVFDADRDLIFAVYEAPWNEENPDAQRLVRIHRADLQRVRAALARECLHPKAQGAWETYPYARDFRVLTAMLIAKGRTCERQNDHDKAATSYADALSLIPVLDRNGLTLHLLIGASTTALVAPELERCVGSGHVSEGALAGLGERLDSILSKRAAWHQALAEDWALDQKIIDDMETGKSDMRDLLDTTAPVPPRLQRLIVDRGRAEINDKLGRVIEDAKKPYWEQSYQMPEPKTVLGMTLLPVFTNSARKVAERDVLLLGLRTQVAIELYRQQRRSLPTALGDLVPAYLSELPLDPFDGKPLRYRQTDGGYVLYSVGPDGSDGGGQDRLDRKTSSGDIIIWPWGPVTKPRTN